MIKILNSACPKHETNKQTPAKRKYWQLDSFFIPLCGSTGKESTCNVGDLGLIPGLGRSPGEGKGYPLHYSGLENSMDCIVTKTVWGHKELDTTERLSLHFTLLCLKLNKKTVCELHFTLICFHSYNPHLLKPGDLYLGKGISPYKDVEERLWPEEVF